MANFLSAAFSKDQQQLGKKINNEFLLFRKDRHFTSRPFNVTVIELT